MTTDSTEPLEGSARHVNVQLLVLERLFASGLSVTIDVLATANIMGAALAPAQATRFSWSVRSQDGAAVRASSGAIIAVDGAVDPAFGDITFVFGPGMADATCVVSDVERADAISLVPRLRALAEHSVVAASCSSTFLLAEAGLLDGGRATTSWWLAPLFRARYRAVDLRQDEIVCRSGRIWTAGAAMAQLDLVLAVVRRFAGHEVAHACARYLVIDEARVSQAPFLVMDHLTQHDDLVARAERWMAQRLGGSIDLDDLARALGASPRTVTRHFVGATGLSPLRYLRRLRVETAARLLATTSLPVAEVASRVGYEDERAFRRAFLAQMGKSPVSFRRSHRAVRRLSTADDE